MQSLKICLKLQEKEMLKCDQHEYKWNLTRLLLNANFVAPVYGVRLLQMKIQQGLLTIQCVFASTLLQSKAWWALHRSFCATKGYVEVFCSFGSTPSMHVILSNFRKVYVKFGFQKLAYNNHCLQNVLSSLCGMYAILCLQIKCRGYSIAELTSCFTSDAKLNDNIVEKLCKTTLSKIKKHRQNFQHQLRIQTTTVKQIKEYCCMNFCRRPWESHQNELICLNVIPKEWSLCCTLKENDSKEIFNFAMLLPKNQLQTKHWHDCKDCVKMSYEW